MSRIVFVQPIFCPNEMMYNFNKDSVLSLQEYLKRNTNTTDMDFVFGGYGVEPYYTSIKDLIKSFIPNAIFFDFQKNYGKAVVVNTMLKEYHKINGSEYIFTLDSDMLFNKDQDNIFNKVERAIKQVFMNGNGMSLNRTLVGIVACNMTGDNAHWINKFENKHTFDDLVISWPNSGVGIGGGCLFIRTKLWNQIGGYRQIGVYAPDDACLMHDCRNNNYLAVVLENCYLHHPGTQNDRKYQSWKEQTARLALSMNYNQALSYTEQFWKDYKG